MKNILLLAALSCLIFSCTQKDIIDIPLEEDPVILCWEHITLDHEPHTNLNQVIPFRINPKQPAQNSILNCSYSFDHHEMKIWSDTLELLYWVDDIIVMSEYTDPFQVAQEDDTLVLDFTAQMNQVANDYQQIIVEGIAITCY